MHYFVYDYEHSIPFISHLILASIIILTFINHLNFSRHEELSSLKQSSKSRSHTCDINTTSTSTFSSPSADDKRSSCATLSPMATRKHEFLQSNHGSVGYGYKASQRGHIDTWRKREFPGLIHPIEIVGTRTHGKSKSAGASKDRDISTGTDTSACKRAVENATVPTVLSKSKSESTTEQTTEDLEVYLDYAGSSIPSLTLLNDIHKKHMYKNNYQILANPHSSGVAAARSKGGIEITKKKLLDFFHAQPGPLYGFRNSNDDDDDDDDDDEDEESNGGNDNDDNNHDDYHPGYDIIFTSGATESLRIIAENFQWSPGCSPGPSPNDTNENASTNAGKSANSTLVYPMNSHTSVVGMRECALGKGATFQCVNASTLFNANETLFHKWALSSSSSSSQNMNSKNEHKQQYCNNVNKNENYDDGFQQDGEKTSHSNNPINHLLILPLECNFSGLRPNNSKVKRIIQSSRNCCSCIYTATSTTATANNKNNNKNGGGGHRTPTSRKSHAHTQTQTQTHAHTYTHRNTHKWYTMLDIAKAACTQPINLKRLDPDFACVSFYKMFGCPTGIGALFIKRPSMSVLLPSASTTASTSTSEMERRYFGGGAVDIVLPGTDFVSLRSSSSNNGSNGSSVTNMITPSSSSSSSSPSVISSKVFVPGTINFRGILSLQPCIDEIYSIGGMEQISYHTKSLALEAVRRLESLRHTNNGRRAVILYGPWSSVVSTCNSDNGRSDRGTNTCSDDNCSGVVIDSFETMVDKLPGPTIAFNIIRHDGSYVGYNEVSKLASLYKHPIQFRTGCFCNPGACQEALELDDDDIKHNFLQGGHVCGDEIDIINEKPTGAVRISFGKDSIWEDLDSLITFLEKTFVSYDCCGNGCGEEESTNTALASSQKEATLSELYIYPIKSCAAMRVSKWKMNRKTASFQYDREFALVDSSGSALRLSTYPKMGLIRPSIDLDKETLVVKGDGFPDLVIDLGRSSCINPMSREIKVCGNRCGGTLWGSHAVSKWFSSFLGVQCWLARYDGSAYVSFPQANGERQIHSYSLNRSKNTSRTGFENEAPILLISQHSVNMLNTVLANQGSKLVNSKYFRPNFVVDVPLRNKSISNPEDSWSNIVLPRHDLTLSMIGQCARCSMVDIDPTSGSKGGKTLRALAEYRRDKGRINFGIFLSSSGSEEKISSNNDQREVLIEEGEKLIIRY